MSSLDFSKSPGITVKMPDGVFQVRKPTLAEIKKLEADSKKAKDKWKPVTDMIAGLGFPENQLLQLTNDQVDDLKDALMPQKKRA